MRRKKSAPCLAASGADRRIDTNSIQKDTDAVKALQTEKRMTVREIAEALGVSVDVVQKYAKEAGHIFLQGKTAYLNEEEVTMVKTLIEKSGAGNFRQPSEVSNMPKTELEYVNTTVEMLRHWMEKSQSLEAKVSELQPKADFCDLAMRSENTLSGEKAAKELKIGRNTLYKKLRTAGIFTAGNMPYQKQIDAGHFVVDFVPIQIGSKIENKPTPRFTANGIKYIARRVL